MLLEKKDLPKTKTQPINIFKDDKIYSFDRDSSYVEITRMSEKISDSTFAIDNKTMDVIKSFDNPEIEYNEDSKELLIKKGKMKFKAKTFEYQLPQFNLENLQECKVDVEKLKIARKFTATVETRPILTSVCLKPNGTLYASDSYVAFRHFNGVCEEKGINIPNTFIDLLNGLNGAILIRFNDYCVVAEDDNHLFIGKLIVGEFPKLDRMMSANGNEITYNYDELKDCCTFANKVGKGNDNSGVIICKFENDRFKAFGLSEFESELICEKIKDFKVYITIERLQLLLDVANEKEKITIQNAGLTYPIYYQKNNDTFVITPIRSDL